MRVRWYGGWWWFVLTCCPSCFSLSSLPTILPSLPTPNSPDSPLVGCVPFVHGRLCACSGRERLGRVQDLSRLVEFQTPTVFDRDFDFHRSICYGRFKIVKIIIYTLYMNRNVSTIFLWPIRII